MSCDLSTHQEYVLSLVQLDTTTNKLQVRISNPPPSCADGFFTSKAATLTVDPNILGAKMTYTGHPVIVVHDRSLVQNIASDPPNNTWIIAAIFIVTAFCMAALFWKNKRKPVADPILRNLPPAVSPAYRATRPAEFTGRSYAPSPVIPQTTIINSGGSNNDFVTGMMVGEMMDRHDTVREVVREVPAPTPTPTPTYSSDRDDTYSSSPSPSSYSSDSGSSSYSSDSSSSSYSSDSSSSSSSSD